MSGLGSIWMMEPRALEAWGRRVAALTETRGTARASELEGLASGRGFRLPAWALGMAGAEWYGLPPVGAWAGCPSHEAVAAMNESLRDGRSVLESGTQIRGQMGIGAARVGRVVIVPVMGVLLKNASMWEMIFGATPTEEITAIVERAGSDPEVDAIVLHVDSPGGIMPGIAELGDAVFKARESKEVVTVVDGFGASAAYYVGSQAHRMVAGRMDEVGSIGVRMLLYDVSEAFSKEGIEAVVIDTGEHKSVGAWGAPVTPAQRKELQRGVDVAYEDFLVAVERGRAIKRGALKPSADGRMFFAGEAMELGLLDGVASIKGVVEELRGRERGSGRRTAASMRRRVATL